MNQANPAEAAAGGVDPLRQAMQELVESSNRALGQSSEKMAALEVELEDLRRQLQSIKRSLSSEQDQPITAEALVSITELLRRLEATTARGNGLCRTFVVAFSGTLLAAALVLSSVALLRGTGGQTSKPPPPAAIDSQSQAQAQPTPQARDTARSGTASSETLQLSCAQPCWLEARDVQTGRRLYYKNLKGSTTLPIGSGLEVFSGRGDVLKIRINDGPEQRFSSIMVAKRTFMPTSR